MIESFSLKPPQKVNPGHSKKEKNEDGKSLYHVLLRRNKCGHVVSTFHEKVRVWAPEVSQQIPLKSAFELARCGFYGEILTYFRSEKQS